jgi:hypothetical protein
MELDTLPVCDDGTDIDPLGLAVPDAVRVPISDTDAEPDSEVVADPVAVPDADPEIDPDADPDTDPVNEPVTDPDTDPVTEPVTGTLAVSLAIGVKLADGVLVSLLEPDGVTEGLVEMAGVRVGDTVGLLLEDTDKDMDTDPVTELVTLVEPEFEGLAVVEGVPDMDPELEAVGVLLDP